MGVEDKESPMMDWLSDKPVDWELFRLEEMHYQEWEDAYVDRTREVEIMRMVADALTRR